MNLVVAAVQTARIVDYQRRLVREERIQGVSVRQRSRSVVLNELATVVGQSLAGLDGLRIAVGAINGPRLERVNVRSRSLAARFTPIFHIDSEEDRLR